MSPGAITQQCAESESTGELKAAHDARHQQHKPLSSDRKQNQVPLQIQSEVQPDPLAIMKAVLEFIWQPHHHTLHGGPIKLGTDKPWDIRP